MPDLFHSLLKQYIGHLRIIAELWGLELTSPKAEGALEELSASLLDPDLLAELMDSLSPEADSAITALLNSGGRLPWVTFTRKYGDIREAGAGKRDREKIHLKPTSATEIRYYRGLIARAFFDTQKGPQEFAYIPDDLIPLISRTDVQPTVPTISVDPLGRPASAGERGQEILANDSILDDATTLLAALRMGRTGFQPDVRLTVLLTSAKLIKKNIIQSEAVRKFLEASRADALSMLLFLHADTRLPAGASLYVSASYEKREAVVNELSGVILGGFAARIRRAPLGVALCMGPYNYAVNEVYTIVVSALIMGNPVIVKAPRYGVLANALLAQALAEAFPPGVVGLVTGSGPTVVGPMMESGKVDVLALIGPRRTAAILQRQHPQPYRLRQVLGLGAKNPAFVLADADLDAAAGEIVSGALTLNGQRCTALTHVLVQRRVADALVERLSERISRLKVGMPWEEGVTVTPLPDPEHPGWHDSLVKDAVQRGARVVNPGGGEHAVTLYRPALVYPVAPQALLFHEEQFGPVVPVSVFDDPEQGIKTASPAR